MIPKSFTYSKNCSFHSYEMDTPILPNSDVFGMIEKRDKTGHTLTMLLLIVQPDQINPYSAGNEFIYLFANSVDPDQRAPRGAL